jgi:hypothetical protein
LKRIEGNKSTDFENSVCGDEIFRVVPMAYWDEALILFNYGLVGAWVLLAFPSTNYKLQTILQTA